MDKKNSLLHFLMSTIENKIYVNETTKMLFSKKHRPLEKKDFEFPLCARRTYCSQRTCRDYVSQMVYTTKLFSLYTESTKIALPAETKDRNPLLKRKSV